MRWCAVADTRSAAHGIDVFLPLADVDRQVLCALTGLTTKHALDKPHTALDEVHVSDGEPNRACHVCRQSPLLSPVSPHKSWCRNKHFLSFQCVNVYISRAKVEISCSCRQSNHDLLFMSKHVTTHYENRAELQLAEQTNC